MSIYSDNGFSELNFNRPAIRRLQADVDAEPVGIVLVRDMSRISSNCADVSEFLDSTMSKGVIVKSVTEGFVYGETDTTTDELAQARQALYTKTIKMLAADKKPRVTVYIRVGSKGQLNCE